MLNSMWPRLVSGFDSRVVHGLLELLVVSSRSASVWDTCPILGLTASALALGFFALTGGMIPMMLVHIDVNDLSFQPGFSFILHCKAEKNSFCRCAPFGLLSLVWNAALACRWI